MHDRFGITVADSERVMAQADGLDREVDDVVALIDRVGHGLNEADRRRLPVMAWDVAAADGVVQELEEDPIWRLAALLRVPERDRDELRRDALRPGAAV